MNNRIKIILVLYFSLVSFFLLGAIYPGSPWLRSGDDIYYNEGFAYYAADHADFDTNNQIVDKAYVDQAVTSINVNYYMIDTASGISDYKLTQITIPTDAIDVKTDVGVVDDQYLQGWISPSGDSPDLLVAGVYDMHIHCKKTAGTKSLSYYWKMYERKADTSEILIATSVTSEKITGVSTEIDIHLLLTDNYEITSGSRVVGKIYASVSGGGSVPTSAIYYNSDTASRWSVPSSTEVLDNIYLKLSGEQTVTGIFTAGAGTIIPENQKVYFNAEKNTYIYYDGSDWNFYYKGVKAFRVTQ